jgi:hypothetical protein
MLMVLDGAEEEESLRRATYAGRPFGEAAFVERLSSLFHRHWQEPPSHASTLDDGAVA